ncbi:MFS monocarboxylate transporter [Venustampulla echinocandica]|uniref:MFS monocarboxylate transporter n=1 Tax=Venustampulla echinocandica TaxID=2656787 RepID=A0A370TB48_9HELO|nr:MFS monocarboxylate transporter [Venustampulla echinocandica]RDL31166.1 MFS monocarboxylate transporter [Venustampulla echinocandica]
MASNGPLPTLSEISPASESRLDHLDDHHKNVTHNLELTAVTTSHSRASLYFPDGGLRAWLVILGSFSVICGTFGLMSSVGLFQSYWQANQLANYSPRDVGWIAAVNIFLNLFLGVQIGPLFDRYGSRYLVLVGSVVYVVSLVVLAECTRYWHFMLVYGVVNGISGACLTTTALAVVAHWFERRRGLASGIAFIGSSVGGIVFPLVLKSTLENLSWAWALRVVALIAGVLLVVGNLCVRGRLPPRRNGGTVDLKCLLDARFGWATAGIACFEFVLFGVLGLLPSYGLSQGFSNQATFNIIAILNAGSAFGRFFSGYLSDRWGRFNTMILTLLWSLIVVLAFWLPVSNNVILFYTFAPLFGFGSGSIISMAPVCLGQLCKADQYGQFYGTSYSIVSFA